jgi:hypothetical protein
VVTNDDFGDPGQGPGGAALSGEKADLPERLAATQRVLISVAVDDSVRARFQRRLTAICDALKAPGADAARCERRLDLLLADLTLEVQTAAETPPGSGS